MIPTDAHKLRTCAISNDISDNGRTYLILCLLFSLRREILLSSSMSLELTSSFLLLVPKLSKAAIARNSLCARACVCHENHLHYIPFTCGSCRYGSESDISRDKARGVIRRLAASCNVGAPKRSQQISHTAESPSRSFGRAADNLYGNLYALNNDVRRCLPARPAGGACLAIKSMRTKRRIAEILGVVIAPIISRLASGNEFVSVLGAKLPSR